MAGKMSTPFYFKNGWKEYIKKEDGRICNPPPKKKNDCCTYVVKHCRTATFFKTCSVGTYIPMH